MPLLEISVIPLGTNIPNIGELVTQSCKVIDGKQLEYRVTPTSTIIKGNLDDLLTIVKQMHSAPFKSGVDRVITSVKIDERHDKSSDMEDMVEEVIDEM